MPPGAAGLGGGTGCSSAQSLPDCRRCARPAARAVHWLLSVLHRGLLLNVAQPFRGCEEYDVNAELGEHAEKTLSISLCGFRGFSVVRASSQALRPALREAVVDVFEAPMKRVFLLSPPLRRPARETGAVASCDVRGGHGATVAHGARWRSVHIRQRLYFRGKLTYARRFAQPPDPTNRIVGAGVQGITPNAGLRSPDTLVSTRPCGIRARRRPMRTTRRIAGRSKRATDAAGGNRAGLRRGAARQQSRRPSTSMCSPGSSASGSGFRRRSSVVAT